MRLIEPILDRGQLVLRYSNSSAFTIPLQVELWGKIEHNSRLCSSTENYNKESQPVWSIEPDWTSVSRQTWRLFFVYDVSSKTHRYSQREQGNVMKERVVIDYNKNSQHTIVRKCGKWTTKVALHLFEEALFNAHVFYSSGKKITYTNFKIAYVREILSDVEKFARLAEKPERSIQG